MADTRRSLADLASLLADNSIGAISEQDVRDLMQSIHPESAMSHFPALASPPSGPFAGQAYLNTTESEIQIWDGSSWQPIRDEINVQSLGISTTGDQTTNINNAIASATAGDRWYWPPGTYSVSGQIQINKSMHWRSNSAIIQQTANSILIDLKSSDVTIDGLTMTGDQYGPTSVASAIWCEGPGLPTNNQNLVYSNITIRNCTINQWRGRGIYLNYVTDFVVENNTIDRVVFTGIYPISTRRGLIRNNTVTNINVPDFGDPTGNSYPIGTNSEIDNADSTAPFAQDHIVYGNTITNAPVWVGIMNHGGERFFAWDNSVDGGGGNAFGYALTWLSAGDPRPASDDTWFINNYATNCPRNAQWVIAAGTGAPDTPPTGPAPTGTLVIGNQYNNTQNMTVYHQDQAVITYNEFTNPLGSGVVLYYTMGSAVIENNTGAAFVNNSDWTSSPASTTPQDPISVNVDSKGLMTWSYPEVSSVSHDSFYIERSTDEVVWSRVAYRPPNDAQVKFSSTNSYFQAFNPLEYQTDNADGYVYRIRAQNGQEVSGWVVASRNSDFTSDFSLDFSSGRDFSDDFSADFY